MRKLAAAAVVATALILAVAWLWPVAPPDEVEPAGVAASDKPGSARTLNDPAPPPLPELFNELPGRGVKPGPEAALAPELSAAEGHLEVKVLAKSQPVPRAVVRLYRRGPRDPNTNTIEWKASGVAATDELGVARLPAPFGGYLVSARAEGYAVARQEVLRRFGEALTRVELSLEKGLTLQGRAVARSNREPVPLAELSLTYEPASAEAWRRIDAPAEEKAYAVADSRGRFLVEGLSSGRYRVEARAVGYARWVKGAVAVPRSEELLVELAGAGVLEGYVLSPDGSGAAGAQVAIAGGEEEVVVSTGQGGGFSAEVGGGSYSVSARRGTMTGALAEPVLVAPGASVRGLTLRLGASAAIEGTVVARSGGAAVVGAFVNISPYKRTGDSGRAVSGEGGAYAVEGLAPGAYDVVVSAKGYSELERRGISVAAGQRFPLKLELEGTGAVEGTVSDSAGQPISGALVRAGGRWGGGNSSGEQAEARTGSSGQYRLEGLRPGVQRVQAQREESSAGAAHLVEVSDGAVAKADFVLPEDGVVVGKVTRKSGAPLEPGHSVRAISRRREVRGPPQLAMAEIDPAGRYRLALPAGTWALSAGPERGRMAMGGSPLEVEAGKTYTVDLVVEEQPTGGLEGLVLEPGGAPSAGALVTLSGTEGGRMGFSIPADEEGRFRIPWEGALPGRGLQASARNGGRTSEWRSLSPTERQLTLQLQPAASVSGQVVSPQGGPIAAFTLRTASLELNDHRGYFRGGELLEFLGDRFELSDQPAGKLELSVRTPDGRVGKTEVALQPGARSQATVVLQQGATVKGSLVSAEDGATLSDASVSVDGRGTPAATGQFEVKELAPGEHVVRAMAPHRKPLERKLTLSAGQLVELGALALERVRAQPGSIGATYGERNGQVRVSYVTPESPAAKAGLLVGDFLIAIEGAPVASPAEAYARSRGAPGSVVKFTIRRGTNEQVLPITRAS